MEIRRYDATLVNDVCGNKDVLIRERRDGLFVLHSDHLAAISSLAHQLSQEKERNARNSAPAPHLIGERKMRTAEMQRAIDQVEARACSCASCHECDGTGNVWFSFGGYARGRYLGNHRCDDLDEIETCDVCGGRGITETCDRCGELDELYAMEEEAEERATKRRT